jgi:hypothetical protein
VVLVALVFVVWMLEIVGPGSGLIVSEYACVAVAAPLWTCIVKLDEIVEVVLEVPEIVVVAAVLVVFRVSPAGSVPDATNHV